MQVRSLVAVTGFSALGLVLGACVGADEDTSAANSALCSDGTVARDGSCTDIRIPTQPKAPKCDPKTDPYKCEKPPTDVPPDIAEPQKPGKSTCKGIDLGGNGEGIKYFDFKDPVTGKPLEWLGNTRVGELVFDPKLGPNAGWVDCVHVDTFDTQRVAPPAGTNVVYGGTKCKFVLDDANSNPYQGSVGRSGGYVRVGTKVFIPIGQRVERTNGFSAGHYVTGTKAIESNGTKSVTWCLPQKGQDAAANVAEGTDLAATGMVEAANTNTNASGMLLQNVATREVCMLSNPHPDNAPYKGPGASGTHCYTDLGAAVNDINGERDPWGLYYGSDWSYHLVVSNGVQVPAAKRPSTKSYPAPGAVNTKSHLLWLVVNQYVSIAN